MSVLYTIDDKKYIFDRGSFKTFYNTKYISEKYDKVHDGKFNKEVFRDEFAKYLSMDSSSIKEWIIGRHDPATKDVVKKVADFLEVDFMNLLIKKDEEGENKMLVDKMMKAGVKETKVYKVVEYTLWNDMTVYLKHRIDTAKKEIYSLFLQDYCVCDISPESAENEERFWEIFNDMIDDECIRAYFQINPCPDEYPEIMFKSNVEKYNQYMKELREELKELGKEHLLTDPSPEEDFLKTPGIQ